MNWKDRRERFRAILDGNACVYPAPVHDPLSARMAEDLGFEAGMLAGSVASMTVLGDPDLTLITLTELAEQCYRIGRASALPLMVDADHGYGNALNVRRTVIELENAGVAAMTLEDTVLPAAFGSKGKRQFISLEEAAAKMKAAVDARSDPSLAIVARTSTIVHTSLNDALRRIEAYAAAGVDALFVARAETRAEVDAVANAVSIPLIFGAVNEEMRDEAYIRARRVKLWPHGHEPFEAAVQSAYATLKAMKEGKQLSGLASHELMKTVTRADDFRRWTKDYLD
jgi:carboxyvinyl-carboxyphosphonate phosphorylmutase